MECLVCKRKGEKTFNINFLCGDAQYTVKDDLTEFLGNGIEPHLKPENVVCNICMNMLDDIAKIKRKLWDILLTPRKSIYPIKLGKSWDFFAKSARNQFEDSDFDDPITPSLTPLSVTSTKSQFWSISHSKEYNQELEERCARREMVKTQRSQSKSSVRSSNSYGNDEEVAKLFRGKKRRGRPKSAGGLPKIMTKKLRKVQSENDRSNSSLSNMSCISYTRLKKDFRPKTPKLIYGEDNELIRPRTRSISRMLFYCSDCLEDKKTLEMYTAHMIVCHNRKACFRCLDCGVNLLTEEHLEMHQKIHSDPVMCTICGEKHDDIVGLKKHTDRHFRYSVPCSYCDLSFLSEYESNMHTFNHHRAKRRKLRDKTQYKIEQMITYVDVDSNNTANIETWDSNYSTKQYGGSLMILNVENRPKFHEPSFDELDYRVRHPGAVIEYNRIQDESPSNSRSSNSPVLGDSDADAPSSDSSASESVSQRKRKTARLQETSVDTDKNLSPESITFGEESDNSEQSDSIQTEMHYLVDGNTLHTNVDLADIVNINGSSGSGMSTQHDDGVELDQDIAND